jgi:hypothetical protein
VENYGRAAWAIDDNIIQRMHFACWITRAADFVILLVFPWPQWLRERAKMLCYACISCPVFSDVIYPECCQ